MYPRKPLAHAEQLARLKRYLRRSKTELKHRYDEFFEATRRRRDCPLEVRIRDRMIDYARDTVSLLEACFEELRRQEALFYAPFKPRDRIIVDRNIRGTEQSFGPYLIVDVSPDKRARFRYECVALTKAGAMYKRGGNTWVWPDASSTIRSSDASLSDEGRWEAEYLRRCSETSHKLAFVAGDISLFEAEESPLGWRRYKRKDRLEPWYVSSKLASPVSKIRPPY